MVIPVYNVEKYLNRCVDSILKQTFQDFEIILINDGSKDNSAKICDDYAQKDKRIKVIHKKNARVSAARNDGMKMAKGKYVSFIDSDDWIEPEMYQEMINRAEELDLDFIMCDYKKRSDDYEDMRTQPIRGGFYSSDDIKNELFKCLIMFEHMEYPPTISNCVCLINLDFIKSNNIFYDEDIYYDEDSIFGSKLMYNAKKFFYLKNYYYYNYYYNPASTTNTYNEKKWDSFLCINERLENYFKKCTDFNFSRQIKLNMLYLTLSALGQIKYAMNNREERVEMIENIIQHPRTRGIFKDFKLPKVHWRTKIIILIIKYKMTRLYGLLALNK